MLTGCTAVFLALMLVSSGGGYRPFKALCRVAFSSTTPEIVFVSLDFCGGRQRRRIVLLVTVLRSAQVGSHTSSSPVGWEAGALRSARLSPQLLAFEAYDVDLTAARVSTFSPNKTCALPFLRCVLHCCLYMCGLLRVFRALLMSCVLRPS